MPHLQVVQAHLVLENPDQYPEVIVAHAQAITQWSAAKRQAMQWLWTNRKMYGVWLRARVGKSPMEKSRAATRALSAQVPRDVLNEFHQAYNYLGRTQTSMGMSMMLFQSLMKMLSCNDTAMMYRYFACCNAKRMDLSLEPVAFLRWVNSAPGIEVLTWRLMKSSST